MNLCIFYFIDILNVNLYKFKRLDFKSVCYKKYFLCKSLIIFNINIHKYNNTPTQHTHISFIIYSLKINYRVLTGLICTKFLVEFSGMGKVKCFVTPINLKICVISIDSIGCMHLGFNSELKDGG